MSEAYRSWPSANEIHILSGETNKLKRMRDCMRRGQPPEFKMQKVMPKKPPEYMHADQTSMYLRTISKMLTTLYRLFDLAQPQRDQGPYAL